MDDDSPLTTDIYQDGGYVYLYYKYNCYLYTVQLASSGTIRNPGNTNIQIN